jgi:endonuclease/exonuclease/phosphatase family metal-dependent hydrolase
MRAGRFSLLALCSFVLLCGSRCASPWQSARDERFSILSYNVHNLFDDEDSGSEYPEFRVGGGAWSGTAYRARLENTGLALKSAFPEGRMPDLVCLQEIDSRKVLEDLASGPLREAGYGWTALGGPPGSPVKCGVLSRLPIESFRVHALEIDSGGESAGRFRDMLEAGIVHEDGGYLAVFVCHWKSRKEGEAETEDFRRKAAALLESRIVELQNQRPDVHVVVCGDFNESPDEFDRAGRKYPSAFMPERSLLTDGGQQGNVGGSAFPDSWYAEALELTGSPSAARVTEGEAVLYSPWFGREGYSYRYRGRDERLDGFLLGPGFDDGKGFEYSDFLVCNAPELTDEEGTPRVWNGTSGFSDHLPIALLLDILPQATDSKGRR